MCAFAFAAAVAVIAGSLYRLSLALFELATPEHCLRRGDTCLCQTTANIDKLLDWLEQNGKPSAVNFG